MKVLKRGDKHLKKTVYENCLRVLSDWLDLKKIEFGYGVNHGK